MNKSSYKAAVNPFEKYATLKNSCKSNLKKNTNPRGTAQ